MSDKVKSPAPTKNSQPISMHENVPVWYDCCSCEAEPYWQDIGKEFEDDQPPSPGNTDKSGKDSSNST